MPIFLFGIGAFALLAGLVMVGFGIPINEFSFGNTLIGAGTTAIVGGLVIIGLGVTAVQLRRIAEALAAQPSGRFAQPAEVFESGAVAHAVPPQGHIPFPARAKSEPHTAASGAVSHVSPFAADDDRPVQSVPPTLPNPDESPFPIEDDILLSPRHQTTAPASNGADRGGFGRPGSDRGSTTGMRPPAPPVRPAPPPPRPLHGANFDAMWPAEAKFTKSPATGEPRPEPKTEALPRDAFAVSSQRGGPEVQKPRAAAILKSGVVDGMGYTLYVDGSIEAELPQGTLRFASINELRSHLEKNS